ALMRRRHADYYLGWAEETLPWLHYPDQRTIDRLEADHENCRAALSWSLTDAADDTSGLRLALTLYPFWHVRGYLSEGRQWLQTTLARSTNSRSMLVARAQACVAELARLQGDYTQAEAWGEASWALAHTLGDTTAMALALIPLGWADYLRNDLAAARERFEASLQLFRALGNEGQITRVLHDLAYLAVVQGNTASALACYEEELALSRASGHEHGVFWALHGMGWVAERQGEWRRAAALYDECLALAHQLRHADGVALALDGLGAVARGEGKYQRASAYFRQSEQVWRRLGRKAIMFLVWQEQGYVALRQAATAQAAAHFTKSVSLAQDLGRTSAIASGLVGLAGVACALRAYVQAARLLGAVATLLAASKQVLEPIDQSECDGCTVAARAQLDAATFERAWAAGQALPPEQVIAEAVALAASAVAASSVSIRSAYPAGLSRREVEVLRLLAQRV